MPEATGVLPESVKIDPSGPYFETPFCSFGGELNIRGQKGIEKWCTGPCFETTTYPWPEGPPCPAGVF